ncbi:hypothetical protein GOP47_0014410 [Adiantum capillus-veneris]|uniref:Stress up-regulated Nod 19 n=1 Tax=Adiantum capillus-veneris TaxID=13818 RepID=A0A9D4ULQ4_ADICA|nr:hypothetical protein GOP47_0014410 [Adiantum capillus-veneris]
MEALKGTYLVLLFVSTLALTSTSPAFAAHTFPSEGENYGANVKNATFRTPAFTLAPGEVRFSLYFGSEFVKGHIGIKAFDAEVVDEDGNSVPLNEVYLHHWVAYNYVNSSANGTTILGNDGVCPDCALCQLFGLGSETRMTNTRLPDPYAIEVGQHDDEEWLLNVHAIDTRGTVDPLGCLECRCDLYNVSAAQDGTPIEEGYRGGLLCCYDGTHCQLKDGYVGENRTLYLQYTVHYLDWSDSILPVKIYIFDASYNGSRCQVEYHVPACSSRNMSTSTECMHMQESIMEVPIGGDVIYGVSHQHAGGVSSAMYGQDGREICTSIPLYGNGTEVGNEAGYLVGMTTCYPKVGSVQVMSGESIRMLSNYSSSKSHTGVMGLGYIAVYPHS